MLSAWDMAVGDVNTVLPLGGLCWSKGGRPRVQSLLACFKSLPQVPGTQVLRVYHMTWETSWKCHLVRVDIGQVERELYLSL